MVSRAEFPSGSGSTTLTITIEWGTWYGGSYRTLEMVWVPTLDRLISPWPAGSWPVRWGRSPGPWPPWQTPPCPPGSSRAGWQGPGWARTGARCRSRPTPTRGSDSSLGTKNFGHLLENSVHTSTAGISPGSWTVTTRYKSSRGAFIMTPVYTNKEMYIRYSQKRIQLHLCRFSWIIFVYLVSWYTFFLLKHCVTTSDTLCIWFSFLIFFWSMK